MVTKYSENLNFENNLLNRLVDKTGSGSSFRLIKIANLISVCVLAIMNALRILLRLFSHVITDILNFDANQVYVDTKNHVIETVRNIGLAVLSFLSILPTLIYSQWNTYWLIPFNHWFMSDKLEVYKCQECQEHLKTQDELKEKLEFVHSRKKFYKDSCHQLIECLKKGEKIINMHEETIRNMRF
ncbi:MAG: hypothetical protein ACOVOR_05275 [Rhabdochlamydiaceae bacterium]